MFQRLFGRGGKEPEEEKKEESKNDINLNKSAVSEQSQSNNVGFGLASRKFQADPFRPVNQKPQIDEYGNLPEVFLEPVPLKLRSHPNQESSRVIMETRVIQNLISSYFGIVKTTVADLVPKTIMAFLVNEIKTKAHMALVDQVYQFENLDQLLAEDPIIVSQRQECQILVKALRDAQVLLSEVTLFRI